MERHSHRHSHTCLCVYFPVCIGLVSFPQMFPLTFDPRVGVKPWQMRWQSSGQNCKHSTTIFCPPPPLRSYPSFLTPSLLAVHLLHNLEKVRESSHYIQTCFNVFAGGILKYTPFNLRITTSVEFNIPNICLVYRRKENKREWSERGSCVKDLDITTVLFASTWCVESLSVMSRMRNVAVWFLHTLLALAFPATFLTLPPSHHPLYCNIPTFFQPFTSSPSPSPSLHSPYAFSSLSDHSCSLYHLSRLPHPAQSQPPPPSSQYIHIPLPFPTHYFLWFSKMPFHRMLPPVYLEKGGWVGWWYYSSGSWLR